MKTKRYRLPDGRATTSRQAYFEAWVRLGDACAAKFGPGWSAVQCDPGVVLSEAHTGTSVHLPQRAALCLSQT